MVVSKAQNQVLFSSRQEKWLWGSLHSAHQPQELQVPCAIVWRKDRGVCSVLLQRSSKIHGALSHLSGSVYTWKPGFCFQQALAWLSTWCCSIILLSLCAAIQACVKLLSNLQHLHIQIPTWLICLAPFIPHTTTPHLSGLG